MIFSCERLNFSFFSFPSSIQYSVIIHCVILVLFSFRIVFKCLVNDLVILNNSSLICLHFIGIILIRVYLEE